MKSRLTSLEVVKWVNSDFMDQIDHRGLSNWEDQVSKSIANVLYRAEEKITIRKGLAQTGFAKRDPPKFRFYLLKKNWAIEVSSSGLPELIELNHLKNSIPPSAKDRLYEVETLKEAWSILKKIMGKVLILEIGLSNNLRESIFLLKLLL